VRQYQVNVDPNKLLSYGIPLSTVIDRVKSSTNEVGGRVLELSGTRYMIRGLGYLKSLDDLANVPVMAKNGNARTHQGSGNSFLRPRYAGRCSRVEW
jgi:Cu(I)/Ag(I) efflux system membrane protein CusA/SilA